MAATGDCNESQPSTASSSTESSQQLCRHFEFHEILLATDNFDESLVIGRGGFGKVYKGNVLNGSTVSVAAIKRLDPMSSQGASEFWAEVKMLSNFRHCHLVSLFGYCNHEEEMILVYEYMPNGTLEDHLHKLDTTLPWLQRLKISIGAARGLDYLHTGTGINNGVIHRDVKSSNILLDESWAAKISDFGLSKTGPTNQPLTYVNTRVKGTFGYLDPDYSFTGMLTRKSDVYAFGVVLLELLCRKRAVDRSLGEEPQNLARWVQESIKEGKLSVIIDSGIRGEISRKCLKEFVPIAVRCLHLNPKQRPTMAEVVVNLSNVLTLQEKTNTSLHTAGKTLFGKMLNMFPSSSPSKGDNSGDNSGISNSHGKMLNMFPSSSPSKGDNSGDNSGISNSHGKMLNMFPSSSPSKGDNSAHGDLMQSSKGNRRNTSLKVFKFADLERATRHFSQDLLLDRGVYRGRVDKNTFAPAREGVGFSVAIKMYNEDRHVGFWETEVSILGWLAHPNIIRILGYCDDKKPQRLIVYECMQNQNLHHFLFGDVAKPLPWGTRLRIMKGVASGLAYMHSLEVPVRHRNVRTTTILLDQDFNAKLGGFRRAGCVPEFREIVTTCVLGTHAYIDPEYIATGHYTVESDIYSFGAVLLETLTGQRAWDWKRPNGERDLVTWVCPFLTERSELEKIMDPRLEQYYSIEGAFGCATLALRCLAYNRKDRPSSEEVLQSLEQIYAANT